MYQVLIAEDEPPIMRYLKKIIETKCENFEVAATAENGQEALKIIRSAHIDLVLTDAKMPFLDGIELISKLKHEFPEILTVVISGYQDFQYVKQAFKSGAQDYLLKPVQPSQMKELLATLAQRLDSIYYQNRQEQLENILLDRPLSEQTPMDLDFSDFYISIIRKNALPARFCTKQRVAESFLFANYDAEKLQQLYQADGVWTIAGRDDNESIVVSGYKTAGNHEFTGVFSDVVQQLGGAHLFYTLVYKDTPIRLEELKENVNRLYQVLDQALIIGKNQIVNVEEHLSENEKSAILEDALQNKLEFLASNKSLPQFKQQLVKLFGQWEEEQRPQVWVEKIIRQILHIVEKTAVPVTGENGADLEKMLDEALCYSTSFGELLASIWDIIDQVMTSCQIPASIKKDAESLLDNVDQYIRNNLAQQYSLQKVCDDFGVSQTYLSRLFRRYKNTSFNEYVTNLRISEAKKIMSENPDMMLKDVANVVGYRDQYYFSRVFKTVTGCSPSAYNNR
ncbi:MAG TPA: response regulator [Clostridiales bacterium]|nr:response regulator [Clostridiales bacterium]